LAYIKSHYDQVQKKPQIERCYSRSWRQLS